MTEKRRRVKITLPKTLLIQIINATEDGKSVEDTFNLLLRKGLEADGKL
jgi:hypothetical protein